jgi:hypothetical protein
MQRIEINIQKKELCMKLVIYKDCTELSYISIAQWHFVENETEIMQHILKMQ